MRYDDYDYVDCLLCTARFSWLSGKGILSIYGIYICLPTGIQAENGGERGTICKGPRGGTEPLAALLLRLTVTCLSWEVDWFICLDECHWLIDFDHDFPDFS